MKAKESIVYPTDEQKQVFKEYFGITRLSWNIALKKSKESNIHSNSYLIDHFEKIANKEYDWYRESKKYEWFNDIYRTVYVNSINELSQKLKKPVTFKRKKDKNQSFTVDLTHETSFKPGLSFISSIGWLKTKDQLDYMYGSGVATISQKNDVYYIELKNKIE